MDEIYGVYGSNDYQTISVKPGKNENSIDIGYFAYRTESFEIDDIKIFKENDRIVSETKIISGDEVEDRMKNAKMDLTIENGTIKLSFDKNVLIFGEENKNTVLELKKDGIIAITEEQKQKALDMVEESNGKNVNKDVFEIIKDTDNYLVLRIKCYVYKHHLNSYDNGINDSYYEIEGTDSIGMYKYYNFDKKNNRFVSLEDITGNSFDKLNEYIKSAIENKKDEWKNGSGEQFAEVPVSLREEDWPYSNFEKIGKPDYFENYFMIDEDNKVVKIRCLGYPDEARKALGDICIDVPFDIFSYVK